MLWWEDSLATGIEEIDQQHKNIFDKAGEILSLDSTTDYRVIKEKFSFLISYVTEHFGKEEIAMLNSYYEGFQEHRGQHSYLVNEIYEINLEFQNNSISEETIDRLKFLIVEWLAKHIDEDDRAMAEHIRNYI